MKKLLKKLLAPVVREVVEEQTKGLHKELRSLNSTVAELVRREAMRQILGTEEKS